MSGTVSLTHRLRVRRASPVLFYDFYDAAGKKEPHFGRAWKPAPTHFRGRKYEVGGRRGVYQNVSCQL